MLKIDNLYIKIGDKIVVENFTFEIGKGEIHAIMGPNGSGKSTLAMTIAGHPRYEVTEGTIQFDTFNLLEMSPDERAKMGIFLAMQYPVGVPGLPVQNFLWNIYKISVQVNQLTSRSVITQKNKKIENNSFGEPVNQDIGKSGTQMKLGDFRLWIREEAEKLGLEQTLLTRGLNDGFSGGEKKKLEILQMLVLRPKLIILDEIDSGLDVDALKIIAKAVSDYVKNSGASVVAITHYSRLLNYLAPDKVHVLKDGRLVRSGGKDLVDEIESTGYKLVDVA